MSEIGEEDCLGNRRIPSYRWERFGVYGNGDGKFYVSVVSGDGGYVFADRFNSEEEAEWAAALFNAAIGVRLAELSK